MFENSILLEHNTIGDNSHKSRLLQSNKKRDDSLVSDAQYAQVLVAVLDELPLLLVLDALPVTQKAHLLSGKHTPRIYSRLVMASREQQQWSTSINA